MREGLYYNPYFPGGAIAMPKMLADGGTEYDDGTDATEAQQAKARPARVTWLLGLAGARAKRPAPAARCAGLTAPPPRTHQCRDRVEQTGTRWHACGPCQ